MFKGFSLCSHVIATAHVNGDLRVFLDNVNGVCRPNLYAIASHGMPSGTGRKGGVPKLKRNRKLPPIETRSVRPCLDTNRTTASTAAMAMPSTGSKPTPQSLPCTVAPSPLSNVQRSVALPHGTSGSFTSVSSGYFPCITSVRRVNDFRPSVTTVNASSHSQVFVGSNVMSYSRSEQPCVGSNVMCSPQSEQPYSKKPFILKFKNNSIKVCQSCRRNYEGPNDTMGLLVAHAERRLMSNLATGVQFLGRESNSHYHLHISCIKKADSTFNGVDLVIPDEVKSKLNDLQRMYLATCFQVSL